MYVCVSYLGNSNESDFSLHEKDVLVTDDMHLKLSSLYKEMFGVQSPPPVLSVFLFVCVCVCLWVWRWDHCCNTCAEDLVNLFSEREYCFHNY